MNEWNSQPGAEKWKINITQSAFCAGRCHYWNIQLNLILPPRVILFCCFHFLTIDESVRLYKLCSTFFRWAPQFAQTPSLRPHSTSPTSASFLPYLSTPYLAFTLPAAYYREMGNLCPSHCKIRMKITTILLKIVYVLISYRNCMKFVENAPQVQK